MGFSVNLSEFPNGKCGLGNLEMLFQSGFRDMQLNILSWGEPVKSASRENYPFNWSQFFCAEL